ncbi:MAG: Gx transporter family protein [Candidatus Omnitrophica bacterium]|nr:Gx transporter family protein [Candidatus Omnitrophota bacterium]
MTKIPATLNIHKTALLVAIACVVQIAESLIPHPVPGLRLGLANVVTLIALVTMGFGAAMEITLLRTILSAFMMGTFMSPTFILSFSAGVMSTAVMGCLFWVRSFPLPFRLGIVGISMAGALTHNVVQIFLAYWLLVKHPGIFLFLPWLAIGSVVMGWVIGIVAGQVCLDLKNGLPVEKETLTAEHASPEFGRYVVGHSFLDRLSAEMKILTLIILSLFVIMVSGLAVYGVLFALLVFLVLAARIPLVFLLIQARRYSLMIAIAFLFPVLFSSGTQVLFQNALIRFTAEGLTTGAVFALRIVFLIFLSALLARTTSPTDLGAGLGRLLKPLEVFGISGERTAMIFAEAWMAIPFFWDISKNIIRSLDFKNVRTPAALMPLLSMFMTRFYLAADSQKTAAGEVSCAP